MTQTDVEDGASWIQRGDMKDKGDGGEGVKRRGRKRVTGLVGQNGLGVH